MKFRIQNRYQDGGWEDCSDWLDQAEAFRRANEYARDAISCGMVRILDQFGRVIRTWAAGSGDDDGCVCGDPLCGQVQQTMYRIEIAGEDGQFRDTGVGIFSALDNAESFNNAVEIAKVVAEEYPSTRVRMKKNGQAVYEHTFQSEAVRDYYRRKLTPEEPAIIPFPTANKFQPLTADDFSRQFMPPSSRLLGLRANGAPFISVATLDQLFASMQAGNAEHPRGRRDYHELLQSLRDWLVRAEKNLATRPA